MKHSFIDKYSDLGSPVHRIDPRIKLIAVFSAIVIMVSEPRGTVSPFIFYSLVTLFIALVSRVPLRFIMSRCLIVSPFIIVAALFYPVSAILTDGYTSLHSLQPAFRVSVSIMAKAFLSVILLTILVSTDKFHNLLLGLRRLKMPRLVGILSALMYRYVFIIYDEALRTSRARDSRTPGKLRVSRLKTFGNQSAMIFLRSWERAQIVYNSMLSRGFNGEFPVLHEISVKGKDIIYFVLIIIAFLAIRLTNYSMGCYLVN